MEARRLRRLELTLFGVGLVAAALFVVLTLPGLATKSAVTQGQSLSDGPILQPGTLAAYQATFLKLPNSSNLGRLRIPDLQMDAAIVEGIDDGDLRKGVGHVPGSAMAGGLGNVILAAHRDRLFRQLRNVRSGMEVQLEQSGSMYRYKVDSYEVVTPDRVDIMAIASEPQVTLITCYPFDFIGSAPKRFIVKAHLVSAIPDAVR